MLRVYLDHSATTPIDPRVVGAMMPYLTAKFGNASSVHTFGQETRAAIDRARRQVAGLVGARVNEIVFTSGGTEANNLAIAGICAAARSKGRHIITSAIEHPSVRGCAEALEKEGWEITRLPVYDGGIVHLEDVRAAIRPDTVLVSVMLANNEIGTLQPIAEIGALVREGRARKQHQLWFHTDDIVFNRDRERHLPHLSNISFRFVEGESLLIHLDMQGVAVSTGSACSSGTLEPSPVINALGRNQELARGAIRFSFGKDNTDEDVEVAVEAITRAVESLRAISPLVRESIAT